MKIQVIELLTQLKNLTPTQKNITCNFCLMTSHSHLDSHVLEWRPGTDLYIDEAHTALDK